MIFTILLAAPACALAATATDADADADAPQAVPADVLSAPAAPVLSDEMIRKAVRETIAEDPRPAPAAGPQAGVLRANTAHARMSAAFDEAKVPDCLHEDALKLQPAKIGPVNVVGPLSLPWIVAAVVRGKCR
jgi:hypothetical protein